MFIFGIINGACNNSYFYINYIIQVTPQSGSLEKKGLVIKKYLVFLLFLSQSTAASNSVEVVSSTVKFIQPALKEEVANSIAISIVKHSRAYGLDWKIVSSILYQESTFQKDPQGCLHKKFGRCADLGLGQINYRTWKTELDLNYWRLLTDVDYNIKTTCQILALHSTHSRDKTWPSRYHSLTHFLRVRYNELIRKRYKKIQNYSKGFEDGLRS